MQIYNLYKLLKEELKNGSNDFIKRLSKQVVIKRHVLIDESKGK